MLCECRGGRERGEGGGVIRTSFLELVRHFALGTGVVDDNSSNVDRRNATRIGG